ncbi:MAG TPA: DUF2461 family protein [Streptosporangiaceae bacterium]|nr:DUF2461 family protein [Streptosporangiaceae bacterium]
MRFHGWPEQAYAVLLELSGEPSRDTRERVRRSREEHVRKPMIDLLNDLADADPWYEDFSVWRYASTAWWWQNQCAVTRVARNINFLFRFNLDGLRISAAWQNPDAEQVASFRAAVAADESGRALEALVSSLTADGYKVRGAVMKRVPRGYQADHPRSGLLRHRSLIATSGLDSDAVHEVGPVYRACERMRPLLGWLCDQLVGTPQQQPRVVRRP